MTTVDRAGQVLAGRYRLLHQLAAGSSGRAYVAYDGRLRRRVAVKVLHEGLAADRSFLERFRAEARVVASLSHPNIVTLHDWGEDPVPFMVLELLTGGSLAAMLRAGHRLAPEQAADVGIQVAAALEHAHSKGLVHRDIKPANLLFDEHGTVRVADFGLARALAEASTTEPTGAVVGTARYAAPEQGAGNQLDGRADLYALGLVLVEAVTGETPLVGETQVSTLTMRASRQVRAPVELGPLGVVVERAGTPYPAERYGSAGVMSRALKAAATMLPDPEPLPLVGLGVDLDEPDPTESVRSSVPAPIAPAELGPDDPTMVPPRRPAPDPTGVAPSRPAPGVAEPGGPPPGSSRRATSRLRRRLVPTIVIGLVLAALVTAAVAVTTAGGTLVHAPNLVGQSETAAGAVLNESGLLISVTSHTHSADPPGTVISQTPPPGEAVKRGGEVDVVVSSGAKAVRLPDVSGQPADDATQQVKDAGFEVTVDHHYDDNVPKGSVILEEPSSREAPKGSMVTLTISDGPAPVAVPNVVGENSPKAQATLKDARFEVTVTEEYSNSVDKGQVIRQDPVGGAEAIPGDTVTIVVSKGPDRVVIPDVRGLTVEEATNKIEAIGLKVDVVGYRPGRLVKRQDPEAGLMLERGRTVTLFV